MKAISKYAPMLKRLSLQAAGKKIGQYGGNQLAKQSFMPQNPWVRPALKAIVGFAGAAYGKGDVIVPIAEGLFQSAIEDAMDQVAIAAGVPVADDPFEQIRQLQRELEEATEQLATLNRGRVTPALPTGGANPDKLKIPGVNGAEYDDPYEAMMAAVEDMVDDEPQQLSNKNYSNYLGMLDVVEGVQDEPSISS